MTQSRGTGAGSPASPPRRPIIAVPGRFAAAASGLRFHAVVAAERLLEAIYAAGGEPLLLLPRDPGALSTRLHVAAGLLLPGGGDLSPASYGARVAHFELDGVDERQDAFDLAACHVARTFDLPLLGICRGAQVLNIASGGTLHQHLDPPHRGLRHVVSLAAGSTLAAAVGSRSVVASCHHHQGIERLGAGLVVSASADDDTIEAIESPGRTLALGVQWHPEDTWDEDARQLRLFRLLVTAAAGDHQFASPEDIA